MEKQKLIYVESKALFSPSEVSDKAIVFIKDTKEIWTHGVYFSCSGTWATPITLSLTGDTTGSVSIDGSENASIATTTKYLSGAGNSLSDYNNAATTLPGRVTYYPMLLNNATNKFPTTSNANAILSLNVHDYSYTYLLGFSSNGNIYYRRRNAGTWETSWETILNSGNYTNFPHTFASLTNKPTTISGYGITDSIPIISGGIVTTDTDLSTLGMTTSGAKLSVSYTNDTNVPSWGKGYSNFLMFRSISDIYGGIATDAFSGDITFIGGRNLETTANNAPNWWFRIKGASGTTYDLNSILNSINNLDSNYLRKSGGIMTGILTLTTGSAYINDTASGYSIYGSVASSNTSIGTSGLATIFSGAPTLNMVLRTSGDNLYHYNHSKSARYLILDTNNYSSYALPLSGGTMTGALNFKNNTWNLVGDDVYIGDCNVGGMLGIKSAYSSSNPGFAFYNLGGTFLGKLYANNSNNLYWTDKLLLTESNVDSFLYEANLKWGGRNISNGYSPLDGAMIPHLGANRLAFINSPVSIEYSRDSGNTWADYPNLSNSLKVGFISGCGANLYIGADGSNNTSVNRLGYQLRITLTASNSNLYTILRKFAIYIITYGCTCFCKLEARTLENINNGVDTWGGLTNTQISGYPGWNIINTAATFGTGGTQYGLIRFTFYIAAQSSTSGRGLAIQHLLGFGGDGWSTPSNMARYGHIYAYDGAQNTVFPANVSASSFSGPLTGNVTGNVTGTASGNLTGISYDSTNRILKLTKNGTTTNVVTFGTNAFSSSKYAGSSSDGGAASSADKLNTNAGNSTTPVYFSNGVPVACTDYGSASVNKANLLACTDKRNSYPALIVTSGGNIGAAFIHKSMLGGAEGTWYDAIVLRGYVDDSAGNENALLFSKNTSSVYHSQYAFGSTTTWGTMYKFLDSRNYSSYALPLGGGTMTGKLTMLSNSFVNLPLIYRTDGAYLSGIRFLNTLGYLGAIGMDAVSGSLRIIDTANATHTVLDSRNYTNYTINNTKSGINNTGFVGVVNGNNLYYHSELSFACFAPDDNLGATSYELIAELTNYGTGTNTSYVTYGISGFMWSYRAGNCNNSSAYPITAIVSIGPYTSSRIRVPVTTNVLVPFIVKYNDKYYLALKKYSSSAGFYFMGQKLNLLTTSIKVNDTSLIEEIKGPEVETSTSMYYYNNGTPQEYLHAGNYSSYALSLTGGTLTGILKSTLTAGSVLGASPIVFTGNVGSSTGINNTYSHLASNLSTHGALLIFLGKAGSLYNGGSIGYWHKGGDRSSSNALTFGLYAADNLMVIQGNGNVGINNTNPSYKLDVGGDIYSSGYIRAKSGFIKTDSSDSYVLLGGGGHKLLSELSSAHTHDWSSITSKPSLLGAMANPLFYPYANDSKLGAYISTINNRFYSADLRYTVTTTNLNGNKHYLFDDNYDNRMLMEPETTATITIEGYNFVYNNGYIMLYFYLYNAYPLKFPKSITAKATNSSGIVYTLNRATAIESGNTIAFLIGLEYLTKLEFTIVSQDDAYCGITNIDYYSRRTENSVRDCAVVTKYNANTLYHNLTAPKYIVSGGTSSQFLKADGSLDSASYLKTEGGTLGSSSATWTELRTLSSTATLRLLSYSDGWNYILSGNSSFTDNTTLALTGYNNNIGSTLYLKFNSIICRSGSYTNIDSGNYSSYALPKSGGTMTGAISSMNITPKTNNTYNLGSTSYYYKGAYSYGFYKNGSSDSYVLLGGGGHKAVSDFAPNNVATLSSSGMGNSDLWTLVFEQSYPASHWYEPIAMFYVKGGTVGCGILCFYNYWNSATKLNAYEKEVWFFGAGKSETSATFGGTNRDINDYLRIYIDTANFKYYIYYNRYNDRDVKILELLFFESPDPLHSSFFTNSTTVVNLPTESSTLVRVPIKTTYNHDRTIKTSKSIYASSFYENSDIRLKENIRRIDLSDLTKLIDLVQFNFKDSDTKKYGVIAQLLELVGLQNLVYENDGKKAVDYISLLVLEIQRLRNEIGELKLEINKKS